MQGPFEFWIQLRRPVFVLSAVPGALQVEKKLPQLFKVTVFNDWMIHHSIGIIKNKQELFQSRNNIAESL